ncbi:MAG: aminoglycoside phosphotransferase family protein [Thermodesulfobacteriota bacterium]
MEMSEADMQAARRLLAERGLAGEVILLARLSADGSDRGFSRLAIGDRTVLAVLPGKLLPQAMAEARAAWRIGGHLHGCGVAVPEILGFDPASGLLLCEDLGDTRLHDLVAQDGPASPRVEECYRQAVTELARLQVLGSRGFQPAWCWDTPRYDRELMLARESGYFRNALCEALLGFEDLPAGLAGEFVRLAERAAMEPADFVLHRDFQSRNLMVTQGRVRIIDFQGARLGPLGYDLASLLLDPYAGLAVDQRQALTSVYLDVLASHIPLDRGRFVEGYYYLAMQRNLQILGAFAFLSHQRGKPFFRQFIQPALSSLRRLLDEEQGRAFPLLAALAERIEQRLARPDMAEIQA